MALNNNKLRIMDQIILSIKQLLCSMISLKTELSLNVDIQLIFILRCYFCNDPS